MEARRLLGLLPYSKDLDLTLKEVLSSVKELLKVDLDDCIQAGFKKLDVHQEDGLDLRLIGKGILKNCKHHPVGTAA